MLRSILFLLLIASVVAAVPPPPKCGSIDIPIKWEISPTYVDNTSSAILGDGAAYENGGSVEALINVCNGTYNATLTLKDTTRSITFSFSKALSTNNYTPAWANGTTPVRANSLNVRYLLYVPKGMYRTQEYKFTTRFVGNLSSGSFAMLPADVDASNTATPNVPIANSPFPNSLVTVQHCPAGAISEACPNPSSETWYVYPAPDMMGSGAAYPVTQVGALLLDIKRLGTTNAGEFSVPFYFKISLLQ